MVTTRLDYAAGAVEAARSVLLELSRLLGEYRDHIVLIGGWVPELLIASDQVQHVGSLDVDLALDHRALQEPGYKTILGLLLSRGYQQDGQQPFIFYRRVKIGEGVFTVQVDLLAGEYEGTGKSRRTQQVQDIRARKARGADLAFDISEEIVVHGRLPEGGIDSASIRIASIVSFLVMKGMALASRVNEKDAMDIYFCVRHYPGGVDALARSFRPHLSKELVWEGLAKIADKFASPDHMGPVSIAIFDRVTDPEERALVQRDAYERIDYLLRDLGIV